MKNKIKVPSIKPHPGYLLAIPYVEQDSPFKSAKETEGIDQKSEILVIGESVIDSQKIERKAHCKVGDIIIHTSSNKEIEIDFIKYRFVHFSEIHGVLKVK